MSTDSDGRSTSSSRRSTSTTSAASTCSAGPSRRPPVLLNPTYGTVTLGQPLAAASILNRLQAISRDAAAEHRRLRDRRRLPHRRRDRVSAAMAFGAAGDETLAYEAGRVTGDEARALGVHVNFAPVVDVNNNPRNPVINTRSFGEDPALVGRLASAYIRGLQAAGVIGDAEAFSRARRHRRRLAPRPADHQASARAARADRAGAVQGRHRAPAPTR